MKASFLFLSMVLFGLLLSQAPTAVSVVCNPNSLSACASSVLNGSPPSSACCTKLKAQKPCLCQYKKNPNFSGYLNSGNARKMMSACGVSIPQC